MTKKHIATSDAKNLKDTFTPLHFLPQQVSGRQDQYVLLGLDNNRKLIAKRISHEEAVTFTQGSHPDKRIPVDDNPAHDIIYVWNDALNEYVPQG